MQPLLLLLALLLPLEARTAAPSHPIHQPFLSEEIIGGHEAKPHSRPYMVFVQFLVGNSKKRCGGALVNEDFVLTAAHCLGSSINITLGAHNIKKQEKTQQIIPVRRAIPHPDYNPKNYSNDIMLLQLVKKAKLTAAVRPLGLPKGKDRVRPGQVCSVAGWGRMAMGTLATTLQVVELIVQEDRECRSRFRGYYMGATQICVGDPKKMKTSFKGDSGGPLVCNNVAQGTFSYGNGNGTPPGVFDKVSHFLPWIKRIMKHFSQQA
ncbi:granzyme H isoform X1 [Acinonyx jubatus]|uniref:Granzyme H isoform X1 n=2 Tax=Acinonyx jubatus TaxID=32536 RepID=A0A6J0A9M5_ACIJB|nr:granzyme H isoform X1 [Acinonyx jubatus]